VGLAVVGWEAEGMEVCKTQTQQQVFESTMLTMGRSHKVNISRD
jgi:hypothetical protein